MTATTRELINKVLSLQWCRDNIVVPLGVNEDRLSREEVLTIAVANFSYLATIGDFIKKRAAAVNLVCQFVERTPEEINKLLDIASSERIISGETIEGYEFTDDAILASLNQVDSDDRNHGIDLDFDDSEEVVIEDDAIDLALEMLSSQIQKAAAQILISSCRSGVSDIHIEPYQDEYKVRVRRDGVMQSYVKMPRSSGIKLTACLKNMAKMDIAERRASQDGKIRRRFEGQPMEFRCSTAPAKHGEKMVLRWLNSKTEMMSLDKLIYDEGTRNSFRSILNEANGIIIVSGPTGSGKSTTLASALREKDNGELNIVTAEDPIEYDLGGSIQQFQVLRAKGQTFAIMLRTFLRQDPDVILIGETRDPETAESSMDAAETGHLVFTTLHANSAASSLTRLVDMEVPSYKLTTALRGILAQRLLRKVCQECSTERPLNDAESLFSGLKKDTPVRVASALTASEKEQRKQEGTLCICCGGTGYQGRIGAFELLKLTKEIRDAIKQQRSSQEIEDIAVKEGMLTLKAYGAKLVANQLTTISELQKICNAEL